MATLVRYVNSSGEEVNLNQFPYKMLISDLLDYENDIVQNGEKIEGFTLDAIKTRKVNIDVHSQRGVSAFENLEKLTRIFGADVKAKTPGRIYIDESYIVCYLNARTTDRWDTGKIISCEYTLVTDMPFWIAEKQYRFLPRDDGESANAKNYPYTYPYVYGRDRVFKIDNDHYDSAEFQMILYGPRQNVNVTIGQNQYKVDYTIAENEYVVIDSRKSAAIDRKVYLVKSTGEIINIFDYRDPTLSIFEPIPIGISGISFGDSGLDLTLFQRRDEPRWSLS